MWDGHNNYYIPNNEGLVLEDFSPETVVGSQTYSSSTGFSFGGNAGLSPSGPTANYNFGINVSTSQSYSIPDLSVISMCGDDANLGNNCKWEYISRNQNYDIDWKDKATFYPPTQLSINTIKVGQSWVWKLDNPKRFDNRDFYLSYTLRAVMCADYRRWKGIFRKKDWGTDGLISTDIHYISIIKPNRDPNYKN